MREEGMREEGREEGTEEEEREKGERIGTQSKPLPLQVLYIYIARREGGNYMCEGHSSFTQIIFIKCYLPYQKCMSQHPRLYTRSEQLWCSRTWVQHTAYRSCLAT